MTEYEKALAYQAQQRARVAAERARAAALAGDSARAASLKRNWRSVTAPPEEVVNE